MKKFSKYHQYSLSNVSIVAVVLAAGLVPHIANAQNADQVDVSQGLEEIVVTAQRRAQSVQDLGASVSALSGQDLERLNVRSASDLANLTSNVTLLNPGGGGMPIFIIRGVGLQTTSVQDVPAAAMYFDEVYLPSNAMGEFGVFDLERVEILKGPQATLYGRNTSGGSISYITRKPTLGEADGYASLQYGSFNRIDVEGAVGLPVSDTLAFRVAGKATRSSRGFQHNIIAGNKDHGELDKQAIRGSLLFQPIDSLSITLTASYSRDKSELPQARPIGIYAVLPDIPDVSIPGTSTGWVLGQFCAPILAGRIDNTQCTTASATSTPITALGDDIDNVMSDVSQDRLDNKSQAYTAHVVYEGDPVTVTSVTSYRRFDYAQMVDGDALPGEIFHIKYSGNIKAFYQELRFQGEFSPRTRWLFGATYGDESIYQPDSTYLIRDSVIENDLAFQTDGIVSPYSLKTKSMAGYFQLEHDFSDKFRMILGGRYTSEKKDFWGQVDFINGSVFGDILFPRTFRSYDFENVSGQARVEWNPGDDALLYASFTRGFKAGGFAGGTLLIPEQIEPYKPEVVYSYEAGFKTSWFNNTLRLNGAAFYYDYRDFQAQRAQIGTLGFVLGSVLTNVGDATYKGVEVDLAWMPVEGLSITFGGGYLDAKITDSDLLAIDSIGDTLFGFDGLRVPNAPKWTANGSIRYDFSVASSLDMALQVDGNYRSTYGHTWRATAFDRPMFREDGWGNLNARIFLSNPGVGWELSAGIENVTNTRYRQEVSRDDNTNYMQIFSPPRTWNIKLRYDF